MLRVSRSRRRAMRSGRRRRRIGDGVWRQAGACNRLRRAVVAVWHTGKAASAGVRGGRGERRESGTGNSPSPRSGSLIFVCACECTGSVLVLSSKHPRAMRARRGCALARRRPSSSALVLTRSTAKVRLGARVRPTLLLLSNHPRPPPQPPGARGQGARRERKLRAGHRHGGGGRTRRQTARAGQLRGCTGGQWKGTVTGQGNTVRQRPRRARIADDFLVPLPRRATRSTAHSCDPCTPRQHSSRWDAVRRLARERRATCC